MYRYLFPVAFRLLLIVFFILYPHTVMKQRFFVKIIRRLCAIAYDDIEVTTKWRRSDDAHNNKI